MLHQAQTTLSVVLGAYYAGLLGLTSPNYTVVGYSLLGLLVLFHARAAHAFSHPRPYVLIAFLALWGTLLHERYQPNSTRSMRDVIEECNTDDRTCQLLRNALQGTPEQHWQAPHAEKRQKALLVLATGMTLVLLPYWGATESANYGSPQWTLLVPIFVWAAWVSWAMSAWSTHFLVMQAEHDMILPPMAPDGVDMTWVTPLVARMQLYMLLGFVLTALLAVAPARSFSMLCVVYLFMGIYFLNDMYRLNRVARVMQFLGDEDGGPATPRFVPGASVLGGVVLLTLLALRRPGEKSNWLLLAVVLGAMSFAVWDTHAIEHLNDATA